MTLPDFIGEPGFEAMFIAAAAALVAVQRGPVHLGTVRVWSRGWRCRCGVAGTHAGSVNGARSERDSNVFRRHLLAAFTQRHRHCSETP